jgi:hypothetical protein
MKPLLGIRVELPWIRGATLQLTRGDLEEIATAIVSTGAGTGPTRPPEASAEAAP